MAKDTSWLKAAPPGTALRLRKMSGGVAKGEEYSVELDAERTGVGFGGCGAGLASEGAKRSDGITSAPSALTPIVGRRRRKVRMGIEVT